MKIMIENRRSYKGIIMGYIKQLWQANALEDYQASGAAFLVERRRGILADDMGLGKTRQALAAVYEMDKFPVIIVCPASVCGVWLNELRSVFNGDGVIVRRGVHLDIKQPFYIFSYEMLVKYASDALSLKPQVLIVDEAHYIKNPGAVRTKSIVRVALGLGQDGNIFLLTGTPIYKVPADLQVLLQLVSDEYTFVNREVFLKKYCGLPEWNAFSHKWEYRGVSNVNELRDRLRSLMIRRTKDSVTLPRKVVQVINLYFDEDELPAIPPQYTGNAGMLSFMRGDMGRKGDLMPYLRKISRMKVSSVIDFVLGLDNCVVFGFFLDSLKEVYKSLPHSVFIKGGEKREVVDQAVADFQSGKYRYFVGSTSVWAGITLTRACNLVFVDMLWNASVMNQAEDRIHRIGQQKDVSIFYFMVEDSLDPVIWKVLAKRDAMAYNVLQKE